MFSESQVEQERQIRDDFDLYRRLLPDVGHAYEALPGEAYKNGVLSARAKRTMAVAVAVAAGCKGCILFQTARALELGATPEELLEACAVAISLGGTMAASQTTRVVRYLNERGLLEGLDRA